MRNGQRIVVCCCAVLIGLFVDLAAQEAGDVKFYNLEKEYRETITYVYRPAHASALEMKQIVRDMLSIYGIIYVNEEANELYVTDVVEKIENLKEILPQLDREGLTAGNNLVSEVVYLEHENAAEVIDIVKHKLSLEGRIYLVSHLNALAITDIPSKIGELRGLLSELDTAAKHIAIEITIVEFNGEEFSKLGINLFNWLQGLSVRAELHGDGPVPTARGGAIIRSRHKETFDPMYGPTEEDKKGPFHLSGEFTVSDIVNFICENGDGTVMANTRIVTKNSKKAMISSGEVIPYRHYDNDQRDYRGKEDTKGTGLHLEVTPNVSSDSLINLKIHPRILDLTGWTPKGAPVVFERKLNTEVKVKDNTVFVLGGLKKREAVKVRTGVPGFKDVPVLRVFFSVKKAAIVEREVLIFIRPSIYTAGTADAQRAQEAVEEFQKKQEYRREE